MEIIVLSQIWLNDPQMQPKLEKMCVGIIFMSLLLQVSMMIILSDVISRHHP